MRGGLRELVRGGSKFFFSCVFSSSRHVLDWTSFWLASDNLPRRKLCSPSSDVRPRYPAVTIL